MLNHPGVIAGIMFFVASPLAAQPSVRVSRAEGVVEMENGLVKARFSIDNRGVRQEYLAARGGQWILLAEGFRPRGVRHVEAEVFADFEGETYGDWKATGEAFGSGPSLGATAPEQLLQGFQGKRLANSYAKSDKPIGKLVSPEFTIRRPFIRFLIGGGNHPGASCIQLIVDGKIAAAQTGRNSDTMGRAQWRVADFIGKKARIEILDNVSGGWGHVEIDQIEFADQPWADAPSLYDTSIDPAHRFLASELVRTIARVEQGDDSARIILQGARGDTAIEQSVGLARGNNHLHIEIKAALAGNPPKLEYLLMPLIVAIDGKLDATSWNAVAVEAQRPKRVRVGVIGCGSVSNSYLPHLIKCPYVEVVSACDIIPSRAKAQAERFTIPHQYPDIEKMLASAEFDLLVNLTDMQEHEHLNREALQAGKHVWSEKPMANSLAAGQELLALAKEKHLRLWGAPAMVVSPAFAFMAKTLAAGKLGRIAAAHAEYGHTGPNWSAFFYQKGGGSLPDLGVYNITTLTGLLGPAKAVTAMTSVVTPTRRIDRVGQIKVTAEDNAMLLLDHGSGVISHVQSGFNYFNPYGHEGSRESRHTISIVGTGGAMGLVGYDWQPLGVELATRDHPTFERHRIELNGFVWQMGASLAAECIAKDKDMLITPEHALHVLEIMRGACQSHDTGRRVELRSTFKFPIVS